MKQLLLSFLLLGSAYYTQAASPVKGTNITTVADRSTVQTSDWKPEPFDLPTAVLPREYRGLDVQQFYARVVATYRTLSKGQVETSAEFAARVANAAKASRSDGHKILYAFRVEDFDYSSGFRYNADKQEFRTTQYGYNCLRPDDKVIAEKFRLCDVASIQRSTGSYVGSNAFGATRTVDEVRDLKFGLAIASNHPIFTKYMTHSNVLLNGFQDHISYPIEKARALRRRDVSVLFIGYVVDESIVEGPSTLIRPTVQSPNDVFVRRFGIPFDITKIVYYISDTGEVLGVRDLY